MSIERCLYTKEKIIGRLELYVFSNKLFEFVGELLVNCFAKMDDLGYFSIEIFRWSL